VKQHEKIYKYIKNHEYFPEDWSIKTDLDISFPIEEYLDGKNILFQIENILKETG
jgi:hypothetical protein